MPTLEAYIPAQVADGVDLAFARIGQPKVLMQVKINGLNGKNFDTDRLLLIILDGAVELDFCTIKSYSVLMEKLDPSSAPSLILGKQEVAGVVWHGMAEEGTGIIGKILKANSLSLRVYFDDYSFEEFKMPEHELSNMKQRLSSEILGG